MEAASLDASKGIDFFPAPGVVEGTGLSARRPPPGGGGRVLARFREGVA